MKKVFASLFVGTICFAVSAPVMAEDPPAKPDREARRAEMLKKFDKDGDGKLSDEERAAMRDALPSGGRRGEGRGEVSAEALKKFDKDGDGKLSDSERTAMREAGREEMIKKYDKDGDGKLSDEERTTMREEMLAKMVSEPSPRVLEQFDADKNGKLEGAEVDKLKEMMKQRGGRDRQRPAKKDAN